MFALVVLLFWLFAVRWEIFPTRFDDTSFGTRLWSLFLPAVSLATPLIAIYQRLLRTDLISMLTVFGIQVGALIGGSIVVEQYFNIPGIGREVIESIIRDDFPIVLAIIVDIAYTYLDPRVRLSE